MFGVRAIWVSSCTVPSAPSFGAATVLSFNFEHPELLSDCWTIGLETVVHTCLWQMREKMTDSSMANQFLKETSQTLWNEELQELINSTSWVFSQDWKSQLSADSWPVLNGDKNNIEVSCINGLNIAYFFVVHFLLVVQRQKLWVLWTHMNQLVRKSLAKPTRTIPVLIVQIFPFSPTWIQLHGIIMKRIVSCMQ